MHGSRTHLCLLAHRAQIGHVEDVVVDNGYRGRNLGIL
jgi:hypothetical protein